MPVPKGWTERVFKPKVRCAKGSHRTKKISSRRRLIICCPRGKWAPRKGRCRVGTRAVSMLKKRS